jgi:hypothetical protein
LAALAASEGARGGVHSALFWDTFPPIPKKFP